MGVRFADIVQKIDPSPPLLNTSNSSPQIDRLGLVTTSTTDYNYYYEHNHRYDEFHHDTNEIYSKCMHSKISLTPGHKSMRRSMSVNDISKLKLTVSILEDEDNENNEHTSMVMITNHGEEGEEEENNSTISGKLAINVTYDKSLNSSSDEKVLINQALNPTSSSPILNRTNPTKSTVVDIGQFNRSIKDLISKFLEAAQPLKKSQTLREEIEDSRQDNLKLFEMLNENKNDDESECLISTSTSDVLEFMDISESLNRCVNFYLKNLTVKKN